MSLAGLTLPDLSAFDPPAAGEGSLDPMGLAAISDRLADRLVPGVRARMQRIRFVTVMVVGAMACETLADELPGDGAATPAICFEWLVIEAFVRRIPARQLPPGIPGSQKARTVTERGQRLSSATYLKAPKVFGFNGVYKPFAVDAEVVGSNVEPATRGAHLARAWEIGEGSPGFVDEAPGSEGARLRSDIRRAVRAAVRAGRCTTPSGSWLLGRLARSLRPDGTGEAEKRQLRELIIDERHETRAELAILVSTIDDDLSEAELLHAVRPACSTQLGAIVDAVVAYERLAALLDASFRTLCAISHSMGAQPLTPQHVASHETIIRAAADLPARYRAATEAMTSIDATEGLEERLGAFAIPRSEGELVEQVFEHHESVQAAKSPNGKRPWFEPLRDGRVVRPPYATPWQPEIGPWFVHPVRVATLQRFMQETR